MDQREVFEGKASWLAEMMGFTDDAGMWKPEELGEVFQHQLAAPVELDLGSLGEEATHGLGAALSTADPPIWSFRDLFHHPRPPVALLKMTKEFAKACQGRPAGLLPEEIATMLYVLSIVTAWTRCGSRITKLDAEGLNYSLRWALDQTWVDESTRTILEDGCRAVAGRGPEADV